MHSLLKRFAISALFLATGFAGGSLFGFFNGLGAFALIDAAPKGAVAVGNLNSLAAGKTEQIQIQLENEVDQALAFYSLASESWWFPIYQSGFFLSDPESTESHVRRAAAYRKTHPSFSHNEMFDQVPEEKEHYVPEYRELAIGIREHLRRVNEMVEKYADE